MGLISATVKHRISDRFSRYEASDVDSEDDVQLAVARAKDFLAGFQNENKVEGHFRAFRSNSG